jgi:hypothetical protein
VIIKFWSAKASFRANAIRSGLADLLCHDGAETWSRKRARGEERLRTSKRGTGRGVHTVSICFSERDWDDLPGQVKDAKRFLKQERNGKELRRLVRGIVVTEACISFPVYSRLSKKIAVQQDYFDHELLALCAKHGLGINLAIYG